MDKAFKSINNNSCEQCDDFISGVTGVVLAGGASSRMGKNKGLLE